MNCDRNPMARERPRRGSATVASHSQTAAQATAAVSLLATATNGGLQATHGGSSCHGSVPLSHPKPAKKENAGTQHAFRLDRGRNLVLTQEQHAHENSANKVTTEVKFNN